MAEKTLLLGWSARAPIIIRELDNYVGAGSLMTVVADSPSIEEDIAAPRRFERSRDDRERCSRTAKSPSRNSSTSAKQASSWNSNSTHVSRAQRVARSAG